MTVQVFVPLPRVGNWNLVQTLGGDLPCGDLLNSLESVGRVESVSAQVADADGDVFEDHKAKFVFEGLALHSLLTRFLLPTRGIVSPTLQPAALRRAA